MEYKKEIEVKCLRDYPEFLEKAAQWFSSKWSIPVEAYYESIQSCINQKTEIPQWYIVLNEHQDIIAGAGVIENDFHKRKDLTPNLCALFVEKIYRNKGIAKYILSFIRNDLNRQDITKLYLITDHTEFYEKCGWEFITTVTSEDNTQERMYVTSTI